MTDISFLPRGIHQHCQHQDYTAMNDGVMMQYEL
jgi:hypothetical protein